MIYSQHVQFDNNLNVCSMEWLWVVNVFSQLLCIFFLLQKRIGIAIS